MGDNLRKKVSLYSISDRHNKVKFSDLANVPTKGLSLLEFFNDLPNILKAKELRIFLEKIVYAIQNKKSICIGMGAHIIKTGISPLLIEAMKKGWVQHIAMNGAGPIHDFELAYQGGTSEDVAKGLEDGSFGMVSETGNFIHSALEKYKSEGYGHAIGRSIYEAKLPYMSLSLLAQAYQLNTPVTVHIGIGTDIIYQHPEANGETMGRASMKDFDTFANILPQLEGGGVFMNLGSAVIIPEVFLKALTIARNTAKSPYDFYTANFDMIQHYRTQFNVLSRPVKKGNSFEFIGHHEIMLPLLFGLVGELV